MIIMGIDPAWRNTGVAVLHVDDKSIAPYFATTIQTSSQDYADLKYIAFKQVADVDKILSGIINVIDDYCPDCIFLETPTGSQSAKACQSYGMVIGIIGSLEYLYPGKIGLVRPDWVKMDTVGSKTAKKAEMIKYAGGRYPGGHWPMFRGKIAVGKGEHIADAFCIIESGLKRYEAELYETLCNNIRSV